MKTILKQIIIVALALLINGVAMAQNVPTLEFSTENNMVVTNAGFGLGTAPISLNFKNDAANNQIFTTNSPTSTLTIGFRNQQFTNLSYGSTDYLGNGSNYNTIQTTGLVFGALPSTSEPYYAGDVTQTAAANNRFSVFGSYTVGGGGPTNNMFTSNPNATGANLGTGINASNTNQKYTGGVNLFTTAQALFNNPAYPVGSRVYFGDVVFTFSTPVLNPVIHIAGLGGSYRFQAANNPSVTLSTFFSSELELQTPGFTSTRMSGNTFFTIDNNKILNNNNANPNGGSTNILNESPFNNFGAASGSVRINGVVKELVYRVYLESGTASQFAWSTKGVDASGNILISGGAAKDPLTGDVWSLSASYEKPTQQISGTVLNDRDGLKDNNINQTAGIANLPTNVNGTLYANLINSDGNVVASVLVNAEGNYLFDKVPVGDYTVQVTTITSAGTYAVPAVAPNTVLPNGWINTGEFNGAVAGNDGLVNGNLAVLNIAANTISINNNFGIERTPESVSFDNFIPTPQLNSVITLTGTLPQLTGSDPEDKPTTASLMGLTVQITQIPNNSQLLYAGSPVSSNQIIPNYNPTLLQIKFTIATDTGLTFFKYAYIDSAGVPDPTPATYIVRWPNLGPLPIVLSEFVAINRDCNAILNWKTSSEINADKYEVEISTSSVFSKVGTIAANGNTSSTSKYAFTYSMQSNVVYYFRLKMIQKDGSFTYSEIRKLSCADSRSLIAIAPNPVVSSFTITGMQVGKNTILIYGNDGKLIKSQIVTNTYADINISSFAKAVYVLRIINENGTTTTQKLIKD